MIIRIKDLSVKTIVGIYDWEKNSERELLLNIEMKFDGSNTTSDKISDTLDYDTISQMLTKEAALTRYGLLEKLAHHLIEKLLEDKRITRARIEIDKPGAIGNARSVSVELEKSN